MLHVGVNAVILGSLDRVCRDVAGQDRILGVVLEVTARESSPVIVHSRRVPAGDIHFIGHLADALTESVCQIFVPCSRYCNADREADGTDAGEVVVDRGRTVAVIGSDFSDAVDRIGLVAAQGDQRVHVVKRHLIHQLIPLRIVFLKTAHIDELKAVGRPGRDCCRVRILVRCGSFRRQVVADVVEGCFGVLSHLKACRSRSGCRIVCEVIRAGQILDISGRVIKLVCRCDMITCTLILPAAGESLGNTEYFGFDLVVRICVDGDLVISCLEDITPGVLLIIGHQLFFADLDIDCLGSAGLQKSCLLKLYKVRAGLLNAAVGIGRIGVYFHDILAGGSAGVGDVDREGNSIPVVRDLAHLLCEGRVGKPVAEGILDDLVIVDEAFRCRRLIEAVADIDAFHIVYERRNGCGLGSCEADRCVLEFVHVGVVEVAEVVPPGSRLEVIDQCVDCPGRRVDLTGYDFAQGGHADMSAGSCPDETLDLRVFFDKTELESVGTVVNDNDVLKVPAHQRDHLLLAVVEHQIVIAGVPVAALVEGIVIGCRSVGCAVLICAVDDRLHVSGKVCALSAGTGDHDHGCTRERLRVRDHVVCVFADIRLGQRPVLGPHAADRAVRLVGGVKITQLGIGLDARVVQALQKAYGFISFIQGAGASAAQHGVGGSPSEYIELCPRSKRKNAVVLQKHCSFFRDLDRQRRGLLRSLLRDRAASADKVEHGAHGTRTDHIHADADARDRRDKSCASDKALSRLGHPADKELDQDRDYNNDADGDQISPD